MIGSSGLCYFHLYYIHRSSRFVDDQNEIQFLAAGYPTFYQDSKDVYEYQYITLRSALSLYVTYSGLLENLTDDAIA